MVLFTDVPWAKLGMMGTQHPISLSAQALFALDTGDIESSVSPQKTNLYICRNVLWHGYEFAVQRQTGLQTKKSELRARQYNPRRDHSAQGFALLHHLTS